MASGGSASRNMLGLDLGFRIATHNEYLRFAAELGGLGVLAFGGLCLLVGLTLRRVDDRREKAMIAGGLTAGAVGLLFANAIAIPAVALPLAVFAGLAVGSVPWSTLTVRRRGTGTG